MVKKSTLRKISLLRRASQRQHHVRSINTAFHNPPLLSQFLLNYRNFDFGPEIFQDYDFNSSRSEGAHDRSLDPPLLQHHPHLSIRYNHDHPQHGSHPSRSFTIHIRWLDKHIWQRPLQTCRSFSTLGRRPRSGNCGRG